MNNTEHYRVVYQCHHNRLQCGCGYIDVQLSPSKLVKSEDALPYSWSMIVSIRVGINNQHVCSGTILDNSYILTAAHCVQNLATENVTIEAGALYQSDPDGIIRHVDHIYIHPTYSRNTYSYINDIAILHLSQPLDLGNDSIISRTCTPSTYNQSISVTQQPLSGTRLAISGWDIIKSANISGSRLLKQAELYAMRANHSNCFLSENESRTQFCVGRVALDRSNIFNVKYFF